MVAALRPQGEAEEAAAEKTSFWEEAELRKTVAAERESRRSTQSLLLLRLMDPSGSTAADRHHRCTETTKAAANLSD